ncbi:hypothetical protein GCM10023185_31820 [Hymenobacter saemangeumensis]|uniref:Uncharacterized protein n=1 Tax=Hymenobacter saemangeumensis TaxID=1084522 RepID=A0ABP8IMD1_9BACT
MPAFNSAAGLRILLVLATPACRPEFYRRLLGEYLFLRTMPKPGILDGAQEFLIDSCRQRAAGLCTAVDGTAKEDLCFSHAQPFYVRDRLE